jgi:ribosome-interacting GTPase 1
MKINFQSPPKILDEKMVYNILRDYKLLNCEVLIRDDNGMLSTLHSLIPQAKLTNSNCRRLN